MPRRPSRMLAAVLVVVALGAAGAVDAQWRRPFEPEDIVLPTAPDPAGFDPCGCLNGLRACLIGAAVNLDGCLRDAPSDIRQTLCYVKFELDVLLCLERTGVCQLTCLP